MNKSRLVHFAHVAVLAFGLCAISMQSFASVVCVGNNNIATSCSGVVYNGTSYDVTWALPNYPAGPTPLFTQVPATASSDAAATADAINGGLNAGSFTNIEYTTETGTSSAIACSSAPCYYVPYSIFATNVGTWESKYLGTPPNWSRDPGTGNQFYPFATQNTRPITVFTPTAVPVPAALPLFLSGIALVGWMGRRQRQGG